MSPFSWPLVRTIYALLARPEAIEPWKTEGNTRRNRNRSRSQKPEAFTNRKQTTTMKTVKKLRVHCCMQQRASREATATQGAAATVYPLNCRETGNPLRTPLLI